MLKMLAERRIRRACPHPAHRVFLSARRRRFGRHEWQRFCDECGRFVGEPTDRCRHCGSPPDADGDHTCSCPNRDEDCADHPAE